MQWMTVEEITLKHTVGAVLSWTAAWTLRSWRTGRTLGCGIRTSWALVARWTWTSWNTLRTRHALARHAIVSFRTGWAYKIAALTVAIIGSFYLEGHLGRARLDLLVRQAVQVVLVRCQYQVYPWDLVDLAHQVSQVVLQDLSDRPGTLCSRPRAKQPERYDFQVNTNALTHLRSITRHSRLTRLAWHTRHAVHAGIARGTGHTRGTLVVLVAVACTRLTLLAVGEHAEDRLLMRRRQRNRILLN